MPSVAAAGTLIDRILESIMAARTSHDTQRKAFGTIDLSPPGFCFLIAHKLIFRAKSD